VMQLLTRNSQGRGRSLPLQDSQFSWRNKPRARRKRGHTRTTAVNLGWEKETIVVYLASC
jgi:hypothetical protein